MEAPNLWEADGVIAAPSVAAWLTASVQSRPRQQLASASPVTTADFSRP